MNQDRCWTVNRDRNVTVISFVENARMIDETLTAGLGDELEELARQADPPLVVMDLAPVEFFGSSFIEVLFRVSKRVSEKADSSFQLCNVAPYCREVLDVTHLTRMWKLHDSREAAVAAALLVPRSLHRTHEGG